MLISYIPILRSKTAEYRALKDLYDYDRIGMVPLLSLPRPEAMPVADRALSPAALRLKTATRLQKAWPDRPIFFDLWPFGDDDHKAVEEFFAETRMRDCLAIPAIRLRRSKPYVAAIWHTIDKDDRGLCLRLTMSDLGLDQIADEVFSLLEEGGVGPDRVDLVIDLGHIREAIDYARIVQRIVALQNWRSYTIAAGSFPQNLSHLERDRKHRLPRLEWTAWKALLGVRPNRRPAFGDYGIIHPVLTSLLIRPNASASIRYTVEDEWLVMRGRGLRSKSGRGHKQYRAQAKMLISEAEYRGSSYSAGDEYVAMVAGEEVGPGTPTTWLHAAINQHLTYVQHQIVSHTTTMDAGHREARLETKGKARQPAALKPRAHSRAQGNELAD